MAIDNKPEYSATLVDEDGRATPMFQQFIDLLALTLDLILDATPAYMKWRNVWQAGRYLVGEVVVDGRWTMIANKITTDRAAPRLTGTPAFVLPDTPTWVPETFPGEIATGMQATLSESGVLASMRVHVPTIAAERIFTANILQVNEDTSTTVLWSYELTAADRAAVAWVTVPAPSMLLLVDETYNFLLTGANTSNPATGYSGDWIYGGEGQDEDAFNGAWVENATDTLITINQIESDGTNASIFLAAIAIGTTIEVVQQLFGPARTNSATYTVTAAPVQTGDRFAIAVTQTNAIGFFELLEDCSISWAGSAARPNIEYVRLAAFWDTGTPSWASLVEGTLDGIALDAETRDAYGVDIEFQEATISSDWDVVALSAES